MDELDALDECIEMAIDKLDKITIKIQCQGEDGLINFLYKHGVTKKKDGWMFSCHVIKLTGKSKSWIQGECGYLNPKDEVFEFYNEGNEAILGLRFYVPIKIHKDDKLKKQDKFLVLELMKGNNEDVFLAYYDFDKKRYYPTNIKFSIKHKIGCVELESENEEKEALFRYSDAGYIKFNGQLIYCGYENLKSESQYNEKKPVVFEDKKSWKCVFFRFIKHSWKVESFMVILAVIFAVTHYWLCFLFVVFVSIVAGLIIWSSKSGVIEKDDVSIYSVPLYRNRGEPSPQPPHETQLESITNTQYKNSEDIKLIPNSNNNKDNKKSDNEVIDNTI